MKMSNVVDEFLLVVPEIKRDFEKNKEFNLVDDESGNYVIWGMGLTPCILELFSEFHNNKEILERVFRFFELMANSEEEVKDLLMYGILEELGDSEEILEQSKLLMGKETLLCSDKIEQFLGRASLRRVRSMEK